MLDTFLNWFSLAIPFLATVGATVISLKLPHERHYWKFVLASVALGLVFSFVVAWQQNRISEQTQSDRISNKKDADDRAHKMLNQLSVKDDAIIFDQNRRIADQNKKIDDLQTALKVQSKNVAQIDQNVNQIGKSAFVTGKAPVKVEVTNPSSTSATSPQYTTSGVLTISQKAKISTRNDAPFETEIVIQTTVEFPNLKIAFSCDKNLVDGGVMFNGTHSMTSQGIVPQHPNTFMLTYGSATPQFGPSNPLVFNVWSKEPVICSKVQTF